MQKNRTSIQGLLWAQSIEAFSDNAWKLVVFTLATRMVLQSSSIEWDQEASRSSQMMASLAILVFLIPMLLMALPAGVIADRFSKRSIVLVMKGAGVALMVAATFSLWWAPSHLFFPFVVLGLMGAQSSLFSPAKFGLLPEILPPEKLSRANGLMQMATMLAIISGTGLGPILLAPDKGGLHPHLSWIAPAILAILALLAFLAALSIQKVPAAAIAKTGSICSLMEAWNAIRVNHKLSLAVLGTALYWFMTSLIGQNILVYAQSLVFHLERGELWQGIPPAAYGVGIAMGAMLAGKLSGERLEPGFIPLGAIAFALNALFLGLFQPEMAGTIILLILMGAGAGMLIVPLQASMQLRAPKDKRGAILAISNGCDIVGLILGSVLAVLMALMGLNLQMILILSAFIIIGITAWAVRMLPDALLRICFLLLTRTFVPIRLEGTERIPLGSPFILWGEKLTLFEGLLLAAALERPVKLVLASDYYRKRSVRFFAKCTRVLFSVSLESGETILKGSANAKESISETPWVFLCNPSDHLPEPFAHDEVPVIPVHLKKEAGNQRYVASFAMERNV